MRTIRLYIALVLFVLAVCVGSLSAVLFYLSARVDSHYDI